MSISISSDRRIERCGHLVVPLTFGMVGYIIAAATKGLAPRYFSLFLMLGGVYGGFNVGLAWVSSTVIISRHALLGRSLTGDYSFPDRWKNVLQRWVL